MRLICAGAGLSLMPESWIQKHRGLWETEIVQRVYCVPQNTPRENRRPDVSNSHHIPCERRPKDGHTPQWASLQLQLQCCDNVGEDPCDRRGEDLERQTGRSSSGGRRNPRGLADDWILLPHQPWRRAEVRRSGIRASETLLRTAHREEDGGMDWPPPKGVRRLPSDGGIQPEWMEASRQAKPDDDDDDDDDDSQSVLLRPAIRTDHMHATSSADLSEAFNFPYDPKKDPDAADPDALPTSSLWPSDLPGFREGLYAYHTQLLHLARRLTRIFALALHLPEAYFDPYIARRPEAGMRILHYPAQRHPVDEQNGIGAHTDVECFTIVTQDAAGGLEVLSQQSGNWVKAEPVAGAFVVNIADCLMRQTNDFFVSTVHRVINTSGRERYSAPFFFGFDREKRLEPVPTCVSEGNPMKYPIMTGGEYYEFRVSKVKG